MTAIFLDPPGGDEARRQSVYAGNLVVHSPNRASLALVEFALGLCREAFGGRDIELAQHELPVAEFAAILAGLKPRFIHHPESKRLLPALLESLGCDPDQTYFDIPRMRTSTSDGYLTTGIAYAFHPHRDTWYSAPMCQINWWIPMLPIEPGNAMAFHPRYFSQGVPNTSAGYNYQDWNKNSRFNAANHIGADTRQQPKAVVPIEAEPDLRIIPPPGGILVFSAAQLHSSVENLTGRTRFSIDFRTVHAGDAARLGGARNVDNHCTGTTMQDYLSMRDLGNLPRDVAALYDNGPPQPALEPGTRA